MSDIIGITKQQLIVFVTACTVIVLFALMSSGSNDEDVNEGLDNDGASVLKDAPELPIDKSKKKLSKEELLKKQKREELLDFKNYRNKKTLPPAPPSPYWKRRVSAADSDSSSSSSSSSTPAHSAPVRQSTPPPNPALSKFSYKPHKRYEPTRFNRGQIFGRGETPLTLLRDKKAPRPAAPSDWDGGYGWVFVAYHASPYELKWRNRSAEFNCQIAGNPLCALRDREFPQEHAGYMKELHRMVPDVGPVGKDCDPNKKENPYPAEPMKFDDAIFSKFEYEYKCTFEPCHTPPAADGPKIGDKKYSYIEPLVGLIRHPLACSGVYANIINKNYMIVDPWVLANVGRSTISPTPPRVLYFDGGASTWDAGAGGASQTWFHSVYSSMCFPFTDWFMWELAGHNPRDIYNRLPGHIKSGYRWMNIPLSVKADSFDNPTNHLLMEAKKEDVVIYKVDFDSPQLELGLIQHLIDSPEAAELVDEFFFEYHGPQEILCGYWGTCHMKTDCHQDMLALFTKLRQRGIRSHSWV